MPHGPIVALMSSRVVPIWASLCLHNAPLRAAQIAIKPGIFLLGKQGLPERCILVRTLIGFKSAYFGIRCHWQFT
jgi:hypothetical protein